MPDTLSPDFARALSLASIPEHSPLFMQIMSGGEALLIDDFLFLTGNGMPGSSRADWLMAVGYRLGLAPGDDLDANARDFSAALDKALDASGAEHCFARRHAAKRPLSGRGHLLRPPCRHPRTRTPAQHS